jgi:hypothetical protein
MRAAIFLLPVILAAGCNQSAAHDGEVQPSGQGDQRSFAVGAFQRISLAGAHDVVVTVGGPASVRAVGPSKALDRLEIRVHDGELIVGNKNQANWSWSGHRDKVVVYVTAPSIEAAAVAGSGEMKVDKVEAPRFQAAVSGSGGLKLPAVKTEDASFTVSGSGNLQAAGAARNVRVSIAGSGNMEGAGLQAADANVSIAGSGGAKLKASGSAYVAIMGSGNAEISGGAKCRVTKMGSGNARCTA